MQVRLSGDTAEAIVSELASCAPIWRSRYVSGAEGRPVAIAFEFRDPVPSGAGEFLSLLSRSVAQAPPSPASLPRMELASATDRLADVRVIFWPEVQYSHDGVGYEVVFPVHGVVEIGWWATP